MINSKKKKKLGEMSNELIKNKYLVNRILLELIFNIFKLL